MDDKPVIDPSAISEPSSARELRLRGYAQYTKGDYKASQEDFEKAISIDANDVEAVYGLGLACKQLGDLKESEKAFQQVLDLLRAGSVENLTRAKMLERLAKGHVNMITLGDWNLEKEIWKRTA